MKDSSKSLIDTAAEIAESVLPEVQKVLASAFNSVGSGDSTASDTEVAAPEADDSAGGNRGRNLLTALVIGGLIAVAAVVIQRILSGRGQDASDNWTSAYTPTPPEAEAAAEAEAPAEDATEEPSA